MNLNIGCGSRKGHNLFKYPDFLNIDVEVNEFNRPYVDVRCDTHYLPFRDFVFNVVLASHVLEHLKNTGTALEEIRRVSWVAIIRVPNVHFYRAGDRKEHLHSWSRWTFKNLLSQVFSEVEIYETWKPLKLPFLKRTAMKLMSLFQHHELTAVCRARSIQDPHNC